MKNTSNHSLPFTKQAKGTTNMANHLTPEIGEGKKFKWITNNAMQKFEADRIISKLGRNFINDN